MSVTIIAAVMVMVAYFLVLYGGVGFIQDKKFFSSAPKEVFPGAHVIGWIIAGIAVLLFAGAAVLSILDGIRNGFSFWNFFARFLIILYVMEIYDICFFDWVLLCHSNFFPHFYPEVDGIMGPYLFGYNKKTHIMHFIIYIPICAVIGWICTFF